ncbi:MAG: response regulator transcription factor [Gemmatimonadaceae bacterium]|nr:response regulator transcription factor [Gemmatimonadaceae bacterium]MCW5825048.1 response regulator transcription factor [Gemmatimonadaceae bacterium]
MAVADAAARTRILVADDEPHIGRIIKTKLEQGPFAVDLVYDGAEALDALDRGPDVGLLILDLMMPRVSGLEVLDRVRADARYDRVPCLILTAAGQDHQETDARRRGADEFMTKPFSPKRLLARAIELVESGR